MGILDDAIREHLDLKRLHGARDDEVKRLEDEAFGPPTRPGEPDFPESQEQATDSANGTEAASVEPVTTGEASSEEATALLEREQADSPEAPSPAGEQTQIDTPPPPPEAAPEPASQEQPAAQAPPAAEHDEPEAAFFDQQLETELDLDDLDLDDEEAREEAPPEPASDEHPAEPTEPPSEEHPAEPASEDEHTIAGLETAEHPMEELVGDDVDAPPPEDQQPAEEPGDEDDDEDVLEETPEFLRDQPEDDELWFEQGEPKDFDF